MASESSRAMESSPAASPGSLLLAFLIADVRGYTRFALEQGDEAAARLADRFAELADGVVGRYSGRVLELRGDEALCVFSSARDALRASVALQTAFRETMTEDPCLPLTVGIGLHAGEAIPVRGGYRGGALNLAARLCSIAGAGEVFCSQTVIELARKSDGLAFADRGEVTLKGFSSPVRVVQVAPEGELPDHLPPLQPILVTHPTNLPDDPTPFIGREREIDQIAGLLEDPHIRMVTLTGPGGTGKTRLALQVATNLLYDYRDGVFFVSLASLADATLVPSTMAEILGIEEQAGRSLLDTVTEQLQRKHLLLLLDNFEHLLDASTVVASLLDGCREVHVLITSRTPLHLSRENEYPVPPLSVPDPTHLPDLATLSGYEAVALFLQRAGAVKPDFGITDDSAAAVAEICYRLDGLPLAIELAAARIKLLPPPALLQRLSSRLKLLTGGARDLPTRQQTLRHTIDWSYSLLTGPEQSLFARLAVFAGGCTFEAAEAVCDPEGELDLLEGVASLVDKNLVRQEGEKEPRFGMLETIREYAAEKLAESEQEQPARRAHASYFLHVGETAEPELTGSEQRVWLERLETEHDNLRAALRWTLVYDPNWSLRLAGTLAYFWWVHGYLSEGRRWLDEALARRTDDKRAQANAFRGAGMLAGADEDARAYLEQSLALCRELGDTTGIARALNQLGIVASNQGEYERARVLLEESLSLNREHDFKRGIHTNLINLGGVAFDQGEHALARQLWEEALAVSQDVADKQGIGVALQNLGDVACEQGDYERARERYTECLALAQEIGARREIAFCLDGLMEIAGAERRTDRAARLGGAGEALREAIGIPLTPPEEARHHQIVVALRGQVDEVSWRNSWLAGRAMTPQEAMELALEVGTEAAERGSQRQEE